MSSSRVQNKDNHGSFYLFPRLPAELRLKIWKSTWEPRLVEPFRILKEKCCEHSLRLDHCFVKHGQPCWGLRRSQTAAFLSDWGDVHDESGKILYSKRDPDLQENRGAFQTITAAAAKSPVTLWVSQESRTATLKCYEICWGLDGGESRIYFNFDLDTLEVRHISVRLQYHHRDLMRLQSVATRHPLGIYIEGYENFHPASPWSLKCLGRPSVFQEIALAFPSLRELLVVQIYNEYTYWYEVEQPGLQEGYDFINTYDFLYSTSNGHAYRRQHEKEGRAMSKFLRPLLVNKYTRELRDLTRIRIDRHEVHQALVQEGWTVITPTITDEGTFDDWMQLGRTVMRDAEEWQEFIWIMTLSWHLEDPLSTNTPLQDNGLFNLELESTWNAWVHLPYFKASERQYQERWRKEA